MGATAAWIFPWHAVSAGGSSKGRTDLDEARKYQGERTEAHHRSKSDNTCFCTNYFNDGKDSKPWKEKVKGTSSQCKEEVWIRQIHHILLLW